MKMVIAAHGLPYKEGNRFPDVEPISIITPKLEAAIGAKWASPEIPLTERTCVKIFHLRSREMVFVKALRVCEDLPLTPLDEGDL